MKRFFIMVVVLLTSTVCISAYAQYDDDKHETREEKKERKAAEKAQEEAVDSLKFQAAKKAMKDMQFVIPADRLTFPNGRTINSDENTNFISVSGESTVIQIAFPNTGFGGFNGLGGITVDGSITNVKHSETKKGNVILEYGALGSSLSAQIYITLMADSNEVMVTVQPNFSGDELTVYGELVPTAASSVYETMPNVVVPR